MKVLVLKSSVNSIEVSYTEALLEKYLEIYKNQSQNKNDEIEIIDLSDLEMANISLNRHNFKEFFNEKHSDYYIDKLKEINKLIIVTPMTNFNYPTLLKNFLDHVLVANKTFSYKYSKKGDAIGLLDNIKVQILAAQGAPLGWYPFANFPENLEGALKFAGMKIHPTILFDGTKSEPNKNFSPKELAQKNINKIEEMAKTF